GLVVLAGAGEQDPAARKRLQGFVKPPVQRGKRPDAADLRAPGERRTRLCQDPGPESVVEVDDDAFTPPYPETRDHHGEVLAGQDLLVVEPLRRAERVKLLE